MSENYQKRDQSGSLDLNSRATHVEMIEGPGLMSTDICTAVSLIFQTQLGQVREGGISHMC